MANHLRKLVLYPLALLALGSWFSGQAHGGEGRHDVAKEIHDAFSVFWDSLDAEQQKTLQFEFDNPLRKDWQFIPMDRKGLQLGTLKVNQQLLAMSVIQTMLSHRGFSQSMQVMALEQVLRELENNSARRDPGKYHLFLFGTPSLTETWGWRIEGHHLSISFTIVDGTMVASTPLFLGANPGEVRQGVHTGLRVLKAEEDLGRELVNRLSAEQQEKAIVTTKAPKDIINGPGRAATELKPLGIGASEMNQEQQDLLKKLVRVYVSKLRQELANQELERIEKAGFEKVYFAWAGNTQPSKPHYYRVQGPTFILEYDNTQNKANHIHVVWRDFKNDFGEDLLKRHYDRESK